jgi:hypothetical protein
VISRATGLFSIYRGLTTNDSGDEIDDNTDPTYVDIPLALRNAGNSTNPPNTATPRSIATFVGRAQSDLDLQAEDRLQDQQRDVWYVVVGQPRAPLSSTRNSDLQFEAHRVR